MYPVPRHLIFQLFFKLNRQAEISLHNTFALDAPLPSDPCPRIPGKIRGGTPHDLPGRRGRWVRQPPAPTSILIVLHFSDTYSILYCTFSQLRSALQFLPAVRAWQCNTATDTQTLACRRARFRGSQRGGPYRRPRILYYIILIM